MQIQLAQKDNALSPEALELSYRLVRRRLARLSDGIQRVAVAVSDVNGPKGGRDKRCRVLVQLAGQPAVVADAVRGDVLAALDRALERVRRGLNRRRKCRLSARTQGLQQHLGPEPSSEP